MDAPAPTPRARLGRDSRLVRTGDFARTYREGSRARGGLMVVVARRNGLGRPRLGLSVGRVIWKSAVRRNRVKRIFREAFRLEQTRLPPDFDLVLIPARPRLEPELAAAREELVRLAAKAVGRFIEKNEAGSPGEPRGRAAAELESGRAPRSEPAP